MVPTYPLREYALVMTRSMLAEDGWDHAGAEPLYAEAAEGWERFELPWERGRSLLGRGRCLLTLGRGPESLEPLRQAREIFAALGAVPSLAQADDLLQRATALTS
jgi:hypothetical protein